jgi:fructokinase
MTLFSALGLGELLWDVLPEGKQLGGAPANFAYHINALGGTGIPVSRVGSDPLGYEALAQLREKGVASAHIEVDRAGRPTGTVDATIDQHGVATYVFPEDVAWDFLEFDETTHTLASTIDAMCFGTLAQRSETSRHASYDLLKRAPNALKIYDINIRQSFYSSNQIRTSLHLADVLKINDDEFNLLTSMYCLPLDEQQALHTLMSRHDLTMIVLTRGGDGSLIIASDGTLSDLPGNQATLVDTIGAGDSFTAAVTLAHLHGMPLDDMNRYACKVAAYVCGQAGAMPPMPHEFHF